MLPTKIFFYLATIFEIIYLINCLRARCFLIPDNDSGVSGLVEFLQDSKETPVTIRVKIFGVNSIHGFHIHEFGNIEGGCMKTGGHYNPTNMTHGAPNDTIRHNGDLGNLNAHGKSVQYEYTDSVINLFGDTSILGKACVIHSKRDDLGKGDGDSKINGNSGARTACGIVQSHNPLKSLLFGLCIVVVGMSLLIYYFIFRKSNKPLIRNERAEELY